MSDRTGEVLLDKYTVERELGRGGMGYVVAARHRELDELVAIKLILTEHARREDVVRRFMREARAAARIASEHVVRVMDVGRLPSGEPYMVMELLRGQDMEQMLRARGPLPVAETIDLVSQVLEAVAEAHAAGIVHRDLKPANLFLSARRNGPPCVKVLDFGISKLTGDVTETQGILGSPLYMSPEQLRSSADVDHHTDIWALGVILFELLTGSLPFVADSLAQLVAQVLHRDPPRLHELRADVPAGLEAVVTRCLEKERTDRFASVGDLARALAPFGTEAARRSLHSVESAFPDVPPRPPLASVPELEIAKADPPASSPAVQRTAVMSAVASTMDPVATRLPSPVRVGWRKPLSLAAAIVVAAGVVMVMYPRRAVTAPPMVVGSRSETAAVPALPPPLANDEPVAAKSAAIPPSASAAPADVATTTSAPSLSALPRSARPPSAKAIAPASATVPPAACSPPYTIGPGGTHVPKPECI